MTYILAALAFASLASGIYVLTLYKGARDDRDRKADDLAREQRAHDQDRRALTESQAAVASLRAAVTARDVLVATSENEVRRLQAALVKAGALADVSDAMGGA